MKKLKKVLSCLLCVFCLLSFAACGNTDSESKTADVSYNGDWEMKPGKFDSQANALKEKIESASDITPTGKVYYLSSDGSNKNSGTSEQEAWKDPTMLDKTAFDAGDTVLFRRDDIFRGSFRVQSGVTYAAYGSGDKPKIYGSKKNYAESKWNEEDENIWVCDDFFAKDVGIIVFEDGKSAGIKQNSAEALCKNYDFLYDTSTRQVKLYFEFGNPSDVFDSIEIGMNQTVINASSPVSDVRIDNLCIKYGGAHGIGIGNGSNITVTNCEIGWIGGSFQVGTTRYGNAIEFWENAVNNTVENCYIYQVYDTGVTNQYDGEPDQPVRVENVSYRNNLIEYCTMSYEFFLDDKKTPEQSYMKNVSFTDNILRYAGYGWGKQRPDVTTASHLKSDDISNSENFVIENNIFDRSASFLINFQWMDKSTSLPVIKGNTYVQPENSRLAKWIDNEKTRFDKNAEKVLTERGIDLKPTIVFCDPENE